MQETYFKNYVTLLNLFYIYVFVEYTHSHTNTYIYPIPLFLCFGKSPGKTAEQSEMLHFPAK